MTVEEYRDALSAAMSAYEEARQGTETQTVHVEVEPVVYTPPVIQQIVLLAAIFLCGLCIGMMIGRWRK